MSRAIRLVCGLAIWLLGNFRVFAESPKISQPSAREKEALQQLLAWQRRADDFRTGHQPDSARACLYRARKLASTIEGPFPLEVAEILFDLGTTYWQRAAYDSAAHYYERAAEGIRTSGYDLRSPQIIALGNKTTVNVGAHLASRYANAGLAWRQQGDLTRAVAFYEKAFGYYEQQQQRAGRRWLLCLLGEAYEEQGNSARARAYYDQALAGIRALPATEFPQRAAQLNDLLRYYADVLLADHQPAVVLRLLREGLAAEARVHPDGLSPVGASLRLMRADAWLTQGLTDSADAELRYLATAPAPADAAERSGLPPNALESWLVWHCLSGRLAYARQQTAVSFAHLRQARQLLQQFDNITAQRRAADVLGRALLQTGQYRAAVAVLAPLSRASVANGGRLNTHTLYQLLEKAYAGTRRYDSAYFYAAQDRQLIDSLRAAQQYASLAAMETRYRTREKELQIARLTERAAEQRRWNLLAWTSGILLTLALGTALLWWYRRRQARRELALRTRLAADLHDDVGSLLSQISLQSALIKDGLYSPEEQRLQLQEMADASRSAVRLLNDVVWAIDAHNDGLNNLVDRMHDYAFETMQPAGVEVAFDAPDELPAADSLPVLVRRNLYLIYKEALHNVVKHAHARHVQVTLRHESGWLRLRVQDDGGGPGPHARASGHGLRNMRQRATEAGGTATTEAVPGGGFAVEVRLPVAQ